MSTITKALSLLDHFTPERMAIGLSEFQRITGSSKATLHRHLQALCSAGILEQTPDALAYRLGPTLSRLAAQRETISSYAAVARPVIDRLSSEVQELVHLSIYDGVTLRSAYHVQLHPHRLRVHFDDAERIHIHATASGAAFSAYLGQDTLLNVIPTSFESFTPKTPASLDEFRTILRQTRAQGYAHAEETREDGVNSISAPVFNHTAQPIGALTITLPASRDTKAARPGRCLALASAAEATTRALGGVTAEELAERWQNWRES